MSSLPSDRSSGLSVGSTLKRKRSDEHIAPASKKSKEQTNGDREVPSTCPSSSSELERRSWSSGIKQCASSVVNMWYVRLGIEKWKEDQDSPSTEIHGTPVDLTEADAFMTELNTLQSKLTSDEVARLQKVARDAKSQPSDTRPIISTLECGYCWNVPVLHSIVRFHCGRHTACADCTLRWVSREKETGTWHESLGAVLKDIVPAYCSLDKTPIKLVTQCPDVDYSLQSMLRGMQLDPGYAKYGRTIDLIFENHGPRTSADVKAINEFDPIPNRAPVVTNYEAYMLSGGEAPVLLGASNQRSLKDSEESGSGESVETLADQQIVDLPQLGSVVESASRGPTPDFDDL